MGHAHFFSFSIPNVGFNTLLTLKPLFTYSPHHVREVIEASPPFPGRGCEDIPTFITVERCRGLEERKKGRPITGPLVPLTALADTSENWRPALWAAKRKKQTLPEKSSHVIYWSKMLQMFYRLMEESAVICCSSSI
ncbi:uncharacterized protein LOC111949140 isoform X2 [Oryzias latipes]